MNDNPPEGGSGRRIELRKPSVRFDIKKIPWLSLTQQVCQEHPLPELKKAVLNRISAFLDIPNEGIAEEKFPNYINECINEIQDRISFFIMSVSSIASEDFDSKNDLLNTARSCKTSTEFAKRFEDKNHNIPPSLLELYWFLIHLDKSFCDEVILEIWELFSQLRNYLQTGEIVPANKEKAPTIISYDRRRNPEDFSHKKQLSFYIKALSQRILPPNEALLDLESIFDANREEVLDAVLLSQFFATLAKIYTRYNQPSTQIQFFAQELLTELPRFASSFSSISVSSVLHALVILDQNNIESKVLKELLQWNKKTIQEANNRDLTMILWACAVLDFLDFALLDPFILEIEDRLRTSPQNFKPIDIKQLYHFHIVTKKLPQAEDIFHKNEARGTRVENIYYSSQLERRAQAMIPSIFGSDFPWRISTAQEMHGFQLDVILERDKQIRGGRADSQRKKYEKRRINIELDGPHHEISRLTDAFRDRIMRLVGFRDVIRIPVRNGMTPEELRSTILQALENSRLRLLVRHN